MPLYTPSAPRGIVAWNQITAVTATTTTATAIAVQTTFTIDPTRMYRLSCSPVLVQSSVGGDIVQIRLLLSAAGGTLTGITTLLTLATAATVTANVASYTVDEEIIFSGGDFGAGVYQAGVGYLRNTGTGNVALNAVVGRPLQIIVEDIGAAMAKVS